MNTGGEQFVGCFIVVCCDCVDGEELGEAHNWMPEMSLFVVLRVWMSKSREKHMDRSSSRQK